MEDESELYPELLLIQCEKAIDVIDKENEAYGQLIDDFQTKIIDCTAIDGKAADSLKDYALDFITVLSLLIEANERDKNDCGILINSVQTVLADKVDVNEILIGCEIHKKIIEIENSIETYLDLIESFEPNGAEYLLYPLYKGKQNDYKDQIEDLERELQEWKNKEERYDTIELETASLFSITPDIRGVAFEAFSEMADSFVNNVYTPNVTGEWKQNLSSMDIKVFFPELYDYLLGLEDENGEKIYTEEQMADFWNYFKNKKSDMLNTLKYLKSNRYDYYIKYFENIRGQISYYCTYKLYLNVYGRVGTLFDPLSDEQIKNNAEYIYLMLRKEGWSKESICGVLGNIEEEGNFNPGVWEEYNDMLSGYGILQFTAYKGKNEFFEYIKKKGYMDSLDYNKLIEENPKQMMDYQLDFFLTSNGWINTSVNGYTLSFEEYKNSKLDPKELALIFEASYERSSDTEEEKKERAIAAENWYGYFEEYD